MNKKWPKFIWLITTMAMVVWILPCGIFWMVQGKYIVGIAGIVLFCMSLFIFNTFAPWKYANTKLWKLLIMPYCMLIISVLLLVFVLTGLDLTIFQYMQYFGWLAPCLGANFIIRHITWDSIMLHQFHKKTTQNSTQK